MRATTLTTEAADKGFEVYLNKCNTQYIENYITKSAFSNILDGAILLSQKNIEERPLMTNLMIIPSGLDPKKVFSDKKLVNVVPVWIHENTLSELSFEELKIYLEIAGDSSSFLVIGVSKIDTFSFKGFLFFSRPLIFPTISSQNKSLRNYELLKKDINIVGDDYRQIIDESVIFSIQNRTVRISIGNETFLKVEKGILFEVPDFSKEISSLMDVSTAFRETTREVTQNPKYDFLLNFEDVERITKDVLREIISTIVDIRHGATLIFGLQLKIDNDKLFQPDAIEIKVPLGEIILESCKIRKDVADEMYYLLNDLNKLDTSRDIQGKLIPLKKAIINLTRTDGAVVFNEKLDVIGAGVFLNMTSSVIGSGGARRKSAESFVEANPGTVAIVISQDGMVNQFPE